MNALQIIGVVMLYTAGLVFMTIILNGLIKKINDVIMWRYKGESLYITIRSKMLTWIVCIILYLTWPIASIVLATRAIIKYFIARKQYNKKVKENEMIRECFDKWIKDGSSV